jgi:hypothetical protein
MSVPLRGRILCVSLLLTGFVLTGCSGGGVPVAAGAQSGPVQHSPSESAENTSPKPVCPQDAEHPPSDDCTVYSWEQRHADNTRYRDQMPVTDEVQARLDSYVGPVRAALEGLAVPASPEDIVAAFASVGWDRGRVQTKGGNGTGVGFGAAATGGCVVGGVSTDGDVTVSAGGYIYDGGCLAATGH